jgi:geranylgeranyl pyrophosphate synthase
LVSNKKSVVAEDEINLDEYMASLGKRIDDRIDSILEKYDFMEFIAPIRLAMVGKAGGKKLRPTIATLICQALGGKDDDNTLEVSVIVELIHQGSLVLDDILDGDKERRGKPSLWMVENIGKSSIVGLIMFLGANKIGIHRVPRAERLVMETVENMAKGNQVDIAGFGWDEKKYMDMIYLKTAYLYGAAAKFGAIMSDANDSITGTAFEYGRNVGMLYQLTDDLTDILKSQKNEMLIGDMRRGKVTLTQIDMFNRDKAAQKFLERYSRREITADELTAFFKIDEKTHSVKYVEDRINAFKSASNASLSAFPNNKYTRALKVLPDYMHDALMKEV